MARITIDQIEVCDVNKAMELLGIGRATLFRWIKNGKLKPIKESVRTYIPYSEIDRLNDKNGAGAG